MQEINFYNSLSKPGRYAINARLARFIIIAWIILLGIIFALQSLDAVFEGGRLSYLRHKEVTTTRQLETLIQNSPEAKHMSQLENTIRAYYEKINHQSTFSKEISEIDDQNKAFTPSHYLHELANAAIPHVWLGKINFQNHGQEITLTGFTYNASLLIDYVSALQKEPNFKSKPFNKVAVIRTGDNVGKLPFIISTKEDKKT